MVTLTKTNITDYMICPWMYYLNQVQGYFPKRMSNAVGVGLLFHGAMETWAKKGEEAAHEYVSKEVMRSFNENKLDPTFKPEKLELNKAMVTGMLEGYPYAVIADAVEVEFSIDFYGFKLAGKWDGDYKDGTRTYLFDYKTKGRIPEFNHGIMARDLQGQLYFHAARQMGMDVVGFEHIIVKRTGLIHGKKETYAMYLQRVRADYSIPKRQDAYYDRQQILYDPDDQKFWANLRVVCEDIQRRLNSGVWPQNIINCRTKWYKPCDYLPICNGELGWEESFDKKGPDHHPELSYGEEADDGDSV